MKFVGYKKFTSKKSGKEFCILYMLYPITEGGKGYQYSVRPTFASIECKIPNDAFMSEVRPIYTSDAFGNAIISGLEVIK